MAPDLKSVADLSQYCQLFKDPENPDKGRLYGSIPGWLVDEIMRAKKFIEGWNSWRVSNMGLLNIGRSEGAQSSSYSVEVCD